MNILKKIGIDDRYRAYIHSLLGTYLFMILFLELKINITPEDIKNLSNTIIQVSSIFASFLMAGLAIILQSPKNENILLMKKIGKYELFIRYFKEAILSSGFSAIIAIFFSLGGTINIYTITFFTLSIFTMVLLNYRIFYFLFKTLENTN